MEELKGVERCELLVGDVQCGLVAGHEPPCVINMTVPLSPDLGRLLEKTMTEYEDGARRYLIARRWLWSACALNLFIAGINFVLVWR